MALWVRNMEVSAACIFGPLHCADEKGWHSCSVIESSNGGVTKVVDKRQHYVGVASLSVFGGNFVLAKVCRGLISVRCSKLRGVRFSEVRNACISPMVKSIEGK